MKPPAVACPKCGADPGEACRNAGGLGHYPSSYTHSARRWAAVHAPPPPPGCPQCTTPRLCGSPAWRTKRGAACQGRPAGPDECDCLNWCGDDPGLRDGRARGCAGFYMIRRPVAIYPRAIVAGNTVAGPFTPLPYDWE